uniref:Protein NDR1 n=1 Tax=Anthurium amnicola TaxID=1678845 RepID=A0A1D1ZAR0_9ARAE
MSPKPKDCGNHDDDDRQSLYKQLFFFFLGLIFLVLLAILVIWLVLRPTKPKFYLQDATVYGFNSSDGPAGSTLTTTIQVTISTRNPNDRIGIYYDKLDVYAAYHSQRITLATAIPPSYQGHNDVIIWSPFLHGPAVPISPYLSLGLSQDQTAGVLLLYVKLDGRLRWKVGSWTSGHYHVFANCPALLSFGGRGGVASGGGAYSPVIRFQQISTCSVDV